MLVVTFSENLLFTLVQQYTHDQVIIVSVKCYLLSTM